MLQTWQTESSFKGTMTIWPIQKQTAKQETHWTRHNKQLTWSENCFLTFFIIKQSNLLSQWQLFLQRQVLDASGQLACVLVPHDGCLGGGWGCKGVGVSGDGGGLTSHCRQLNCMVVMATRCCGDELSCGCPWSTLFLKRKKKTTLLITNFYKWKLN